MNQSSLRARRRRWALRVGLLVVSYATLLESHAHDQWLYGGAVARGSSDPVSLVVFVVLVVTSLWLTRERY